MTCKEPDSGESDLETSCSVEIREGRLGRGVHARRDVRPGEVLIRCWGKLVPQRTQHSIQIDVDQHLDVDAPLRYLNHCCEPNCGLLIRPGARLLEVHALRPIAAGEELTLDYCTFEQEILFMPGACLCGAPGCRGLVTGFKDLSHAQVEAYGPYVAEYLHQASLVGAK